MGTQLVGANNFRSSRKIGNRIGTKHVHGCVAVIFYRNHHVGLGHFYMGIGAERLLIRKNGMTVSNETWFHANEYAYREVVSREDFLLSLKDPKERETIIEINNEVDVRKNP